MKKSASRIRDDIAKLQEQLKQAETRDAERIGRIALKAGLGEIEIDEAELQAVFEEVAKRFRAGKTASAGRRKPGEGASAGSQATVVATGTIARSDGEA